MSVAVKKMYLPVTLIILLHFNSITKTIAQTQWAPIGAKWVNESVRVESGLFYLITYESEKDTMVLGKNCKKILKTVLCHSNGMVKPCNPEKELSTFFIYNENEKVYYSKGDSFFLMYYFSLKTGDTLSVYQEYIFYKDSFNLNKYKITAIDSIKISGKYLKRQHLQLIVTDPTYTWYYYYYGYIIERIGNIESLFGTHPDPNDDGAPFLKCYSDGEIFYQDSNFVNCNGLEAISDPGSPLEIQIYPNPANDKLNIDCAIVRYLSMQVYNTVGQCVLQKELNNKTNTIDISSLTRGIYILKFSSANGTFEKKIIKE